MKPSDVKSYEKLLIIFGLFAILMLVQNFRSIAKNNSNDYHDQGQYSAQGDQARHGFDGTSRQRELIGITIKTKLQAHYENQQVWPLTSELEQSGREHYSGLPYRSIRDNYRLATNDHRNVPQPTDREQNGNHYSANKDAIMGEMVALVRLRMLRGLSASIYTKNRITCHTFIEEKLRQIS
jgi:hypothetical protein